MPSDDPVSRQELERGLRFLNNAMTQMRDELLQLGAQVVTLTRLLEERGSVSQAEVVAALPAAADQVRAMDEASPPLRVELGEEVVDKRDVATPDIPCAELIHLCKARCCKLTFRLSTQDLEERVIRWDLGRPYWNLRRSDGYCVHNQPTLGCSVYQQRPAPCRRFDCRRDERIWTDYEGRIPAPDQLDALPASPSPPRSQEMMAERAQARRLAADLEDITLRFDRR